MKYSVGAIKNPADKTQRQKVAALATETKQALAETVAGYSNADAMLVANADKLDSSLNKLDSSLNKLTTSGMGLSRFFFFFFLIIPTIVAGDTATVNTALEAAQSALSQQGLLTRAVTNKAPTPKAKAAILKDADAAEKLVP
jgi:hypothetical protein